MELWEVLLDLSFVETSVEFAFENNLHGLDTHARDNETKAVQGNKILCGRLLCHWYVQNGLWNDYYVIAVNKHNRVFERFGHYTCKRPILWHPAEERLVTSSCFFPRNAYQVLSSPRKVHTWVSEHSFPASLKVRLCENGDAPVDRHQIACRPPKLVRKEYIDLIGSISKILADVQLLNNGFHLFVKIIAPADLHILPKTI
eukprot:XP_001707238.1 Hypothetical protein GL50803_103480 [Giardia lamblia ATCC 50803]